MKLANKKALFLKTKNIGDSIILTSAISALPNQFDFVDVVCLPESEEIFRMNPRVDRVFAVPRHLKGYKKFKSYLYIYSQLKAQNYHLLVQFSNDWRGAILSRILSPIISVAKKSDKRNSFWHNSFKFIADVSSNRRPQCEQDVDLLRRVNYFNHADAPMYFLEPSQAAFYRINLWIKLNVTPKLQKKIIIMHASSRWKFKELSNPQWAHVIDELVAKNFAVILTGDNTDIHHNQAISDLCKSKVILAESFSIQEVAALIKLSKLVISIDSMMIHLASAIQVPVLAIFGPTNEMNWAPWKVSHKVLALSKDDSPSFACRPCGKDGCGGSKVSNCLFNVDPDFIVSEGLSLLKGI